MHQFVRNSFVCGAALALLSFAACEREDADPIERTPPPITEPERDPVMPPAQPGVETAPREGTGATAGTLDPQAFVTEAASAGRFEVESSQLASGKEVTDQVAQFAQMMVEDHQRANDQLSQIAQNAGITVSDTLASKHQQQLDELNGLEGEEFQRKYLEVQVKAHEEAVDLFRRASQQLQQEELRSFAEETLPVLEKHLEEARTLQNR